MVVPAGNELLAWPRRCQAEALGRGVLQGTPFTDLLGFGLGDPQSPRTL